MLHGILTVVYVFLHLRRSSVLLALSMSSGTLLLCRRLLRARAGLLHVRNFGTFDGQCLVACARCSGFSASPRTRLSGCLARGRRVLWREGEVAEAPASLPVAECLNDIDDPHALYRSPRLARQGSALSLSLRRGGCMWSPCINVSV